MASSTPNINLTLPIGSEKVSRQIINDNNTKIDTAIGALPSGQNLQGEIDALNNKLTNLYKENVGVASTTDLDDCKELGTLYWTSANESLISNKPFGETAGYVFVVPCGTRCVQFYMSTENMYFRYGTGSTWYPWVKLSNN